MYRWRSILVHVLFRVFANRFAPENLFVASTYKAILDHVAESALQDADLRLSTQVTHITSNSKSEPSHSMNVAVSTHRHEEPFLCDEVVVTAPLGYLQRNLSIFSPPLPTRLSMAIEQGSYGRLEKVYVMFSSAYWSKVSSQDAPKAFFTQFLSPAYAAKENPKGWNMNCASLAELPGELAQPTLLFYMHGECAEHVTSLVSGQDPGSIEYYDLLRPFFEPYYSRLPNYSSVSNGCIPTGFFATDWQHDEFAGYGSYTNFQVSHCDQEVLLDENIKFMRKGLPERNVWLAGEHTAPLVALGTVTGAYWSGEAVAQRILNAYGMVDGQQDGLNDQHKASVGGEEDGKAENPEVPVKGTSHAAGVVGL